MMRFPKLLGVVVLCLSGAVWAVDTDQDALPDDWELANGRDPQRPDFQIEANSYIWGDNVTRTDRCKLMEGVLTCNWFVGGGIPGTIPFSSGVSPANVYGVDLSTTANVRLYRGNNISAYTNSWNIYIYPPSVADVSAAFSVRALPMSHSASRIFTLPQLSLYCGGGQATETVSCETQNDHHLACTRMTPYVYRPGVGQCASDIEIATTVYATKGTIAHVAGIGTTTICAMTEYGSECFGGSDVFALIHDLDGDGLSSSGDNCPLQANADQVNGDGDQYGDVCDVMPADPDNDGVDSAADNCPAANNANQLDTDGDGQGDACDTDDDNDTSSDVFDRFPLNRAASHDRDVDGFPTQWNAGCDSVCQANSGLTLDNCPTLSNPTQANFDGDAQGDICDADDDNDGDLDGNDNCPVNANADQLNTDGDTQGDACDTDDDNDGVLDTSDDFATDDCAMTDTDGDGLPNDIYCLSPASAPPDGTYSGNALWAFTYSTNGITASISGVGGVSLLPVTLLKPRTLTYSKTDPSNRLSVWYASGTILSAGTYAIWLNAGAPCAGYGCLLPGSFNNIQLGWTNLMLDADDDNDSVLDVNDVFPLDAAESVDTDGDTIGNNADWDDDNDGVPDNIDAAPLNVGDTSEITLPLDSNYKGSQLKGVRDAIH